MTRTQRSCQHLYPSFIYPVTSPLAAMRPYSQSSELQENQAVAQTQHAFYVPLVPPKSLFEPLSLSAGSSSQNPRRVPGPFDYQQGARMGRFKTHTVEAWLIRFIGCVSISRRVYCACAGEMVCQHQPEKMRPVEQGQLKQNISHGLINNIGNVFLTALSTTLLLTVSNCVSDASRKPSRMVVYLLTRRHHTWDPPRVTMHLPAPPTNIHSPRRLTHLKTQVMRIPMSMAAGSMTHRLDMAQWFSFT